MTQVKYQKIRDAGDPTVLAWIWSGAVIICVALSAWLASQDAAFVPSFFAWLVAFVISVGLMLAAFSISALIAATLHRSGRYELALIAFVLLACGLCFSAALASGRIPVSKEVSARQAAIMSWLAKQSK